MFDLWKWTFCLVFTWVLFLIPFSFYLYETDEDDNIIKRIGFSFLYAVIFTCIIVIILVVLYYIGLGKTDIPIEIYKRGFEKDHLPSWRESGGDVTNHSSDETTSSTIGY